MIIVDSFQPLTIITKSSTLDVAAVLHPPLNFSNVIKKEEMNMDEHERQLMPGFLKKGEKHLPVEIRSFNQK